MNKTREETIKEIESILFTCPICGTPAKVIPQLEYWYIVCPNKRIKHAVEVGPYKRLKVAVDTWQSYRGYKS